jgi:TPR repeat protein
MDVVDIDTVDLLTRADAAERTETQVGFAAAVDLYREAVRRGSREACVRLGRLLLAWASNDRDLRLGGKLLARAARRGDAEAPSVLARYALAVGDDARARHWLDGQRSAAPEWQVHDLFARWRTGSLSSMQVADELLRLCKQWPDATFELAVLLIRGAEDLPPQRWSARTLLRRLTAHSYPLVGYGWGLYELRWGGSVRRAARWMSSAASLGHADACLFCGWHALRRSRGRCTAAWQLVRRAAAMNIVEARAMLALPAPESSHPSPPISLASAVMRVAGFWNDRRIIAFYAAAIVVTVAWFGWPGFA